MEINYSKITNVNKGKGLKTKDFKALLNKSYDSKISNHDDFIVDKDLSGKRVQVYHNPKNNQVVISHRGSQGIHDWINNIRVGLFNDKSSNRFKHSKNIQQQAYNKYGLDNKYVTIGHSLGSNIAKTVSKPNDEVIGYNGYTTLYDKPKNNQYDIRTNNDVASFLLKNNPNLKSFKSDTNDLIDTHGINKLDKFNDEMVGKINNGKGLKNKKLISTKNI
jgi:hypothetical protein